MKRREKKMDVETNKKIDNPIHFSRIRNLLPDRSPYLTKTKIHYQHHTQNTIANRLI